MTKRALLGGLDISGLVTSWGEIEKTKTIILGQDSLFVSEHTLTLGNKGRWTDPGGSPSTIKGLDWYGETFKLYIDDRLAFDGVATNMKPNAQTQETMLVAQNRLKAAAEETVALAMTDTDPGAAMLAALDQTRAAPYVDRNSFIQAGQARAAAGAFINANYPAGDGHTALDVLQDIGDLASIAVTEEAGIITARAFQPYQGSGADLGFPITDALVREWGDWEWDETAFRNRVEMGYPTDAYEVLNDLESQRRNKGTIKTEPFRAGGNVLASNQGAARALGTIYLARAALRRATTTATGGPQLAKARLGDRYPITAGALGLTAYPVETIGIKIALDTEDTTLTLAQLA